MSIPRIPILQLLHMFAPAYHCRMSNMNLGGRIPLLTPGDLSPEQQELYAAVAGTRGARAAEAGYHATDDKGRLIGPFNAFLGAPEIGAAQLRWAEAIAHSTLPANVREAVILTVAGIWDSSYMRYAHAAAGSRAGLSGDAIAALLAGDMSPGLAEAPLLASRVARSLLTRHELDDALYQAAAEHFGVSGLVALIALIGQYTTTAAILAGFDVPAPASL